MGENNAIIIQNKYSALINCTKGESLSALPLVCQLVVIGIGFQTSS